jgi:hypothetical protein
MAFSSGTYTLPGPALVTGGTVSSTENNTFRNDVAASFNKTLLRDGTASASANIPMGSFKLTGLGVATNSGDALSYGQAATVSDLTTTGNTILGDASTDTLNVGNGGLIKDASGNVGVGVTPNAWDAATSKALQLPAGSVWNYTTIQMNLGFNYFWNGTNYKYKNTGYATSFDQSGGAFYWQQAASGTAGNTATFTQAMTLDASGNLLVGTTSLAASSVGAVIQPSGFMANHVAASTNSTTCYDLYSTTASAYRFYAGLGGTIYATSTTITAISDQRLKENIRDLDEGLATVMALKPRKFDWKEGKGADIKNARGFIAQEFEQVLPDMIDEWKDPAPEGEEPYKAVNANLIPTLVKAIQELNAKFEEYKAAHP